MSIVSLLNVNVLNNPAPFTAPYEFEITFECLEPLKDDLEWKLIYVGSSSSFEHDQELDSLLVGPVPVGVNKFVFSADPPSPDLIPASELVSVTVILLSCSYNGKEFVRVGYYVNNEYDNEEMRNDPPSKVQIDRVVRNILAEKPRVTRFNIVWDNEGAADEFPPEQPDADLAEDDEDQYGADDLDGEEEADEEDEGDDDNATGAEPEADLQNQEDDAEEDIEDEVEVDDTNDKQVDSNASKAGDDDAAKQDPSQETAIGK